MLDLGSVYERRRGWYYARAGLTRPVYLKFFELERPALFYEEDVTLRKLAREDRDLTGKLPWLRLPLDSLLYDAGGPTVALGIGGPDPELAESRIEMVVRELEEDERLEVEEADPPEIPESVVQSLIAVRMVEPRALGRPYLIAARVEEGRRAVERLRRELWLEAKSAGVGSARRERLNRRMEFLGTVSPPFCFRLVASRLSRGPPSGELERLVRLKLPRVYTTPLDAALVTAALLADLRD